MDPMRDVTLNVACICPYFFHCILPLRLGIHNNDNTAEYIQKKYQEISSVQGKGRKIDIPQGGRPRYQHHRIPHKCLQNRLLEKFLVPTAFQQQQEEGHETSHTTVTTTHDSRHTGRLRTKLTFCHQPPQVVVASKHGQEVSRYLNNGGGMAAGKWC